MNYPIAMETFNAKPANCKETSLYSYYILHIATLMVYWYKKVNQRRELLMRKIVYKLTYIILVMSLLLSISTGCALKEKESNTVDNLNPDQMQEVTLRFITCSSGVDDNLQKKVLTEIEKRSFAYLKARLEFKQIAQGTYETEVRKLLSSGDTFDAMYSPHRYFFQLLAKDGLLLDITKLFPRYAPGFYTKFSKEELKQASYDGKLVAVSKFWPGTSRICAVVNEELAAKYNIHDIKSFDDYEIFLKTIKEEENGIAPATGKWGTDIFMEQSGFVRASDNYPPNMVYDWTKPEIKVVPWEQTSAFRVAYETLKRWYKNGYIDNSVLEEGEGYDNAVRAGKSASTLMSFDGAYAVAHSIQTKVNLSIFPLYMDRVSVKLPIASESIVLNKNAANPERALMFIDWIHSKQENYDLFMYGLEGENYTLKDGKLVLPQRQSRYYGWYGSRAFLDIDLNRPMNNEPDSVNKMVADVASNAKYPCTTGFMPDLSGINDMLAKWITSYFNFEKEIREGKFETNIDQFIETQKRDRADDIAKEVQRQLDKWIENN